MGRKKIDVFLAGIIQGSIKEMEIHDQSYRTRVKRMIEENVPGAGVYCPIENHPNSLGYSEQKGRDVFLRHNQQASEADVLVAFIPEASMGTAIEMWEAHKAGKVVLSISPLDANWVIKFLPDRNFLSLSEFEEFAKSGEMKAMLEERIG